VDRAGNYHPGVSEASLAITLRPRPRDTWEVEMRQGGDYGGYELTSTYDLQQARYEGVSSASPRPDASAVAVRVERAAGTRDYGSPMPGLLWTRPRSSIGWLPACCCRGSWRGVRSSPRSWGRGSASQRSAGASSARAGHCSSLPWQALTKWWGAISPKRSGSI